MDGLDYQNLKDLGLPGIVAAAIAAAAFWRRKDYDHGSDIGRELDLFRREMIDRLARIETKLEAIEERK